MNFFLASVKEIMGLFQGLNSWKCPHSELLSWYTQCWSVKMVVEDIARIVECFENPTEPQRSITGIFNNLHSKGVPELLSASYHHLKVFFFFLWELLRIFPLHRHLVLAQENKQPNKTFQFQFNHLRHATYHLMYFPSRSKRHFYLLVVYVSIIQYAFL